MKETGLDNRRQRLREILASDRCITACSVFDPMSARIADRLGFEVGVMGGSVASLAILGAPDIALITLPELVEQARRVCRAARIGLLVDADHGYGNALNVMRTVEELACAGVAGISIEDTELPAPFGSAGASRLVSLEEGLGKMRAAVRARGDTGMVIMARTNAATVTDVSDAIARFRAYQETGVDALFLPTLRTREELDAIAANVRLPLVLAGCNESLQDIDYLSARGVKVWMAGHQPFTAAVQALYQAMEAVRQGARPSALPGLAPAALMQALTKADELRGLGREFGID
jgi:oxaloacetate decarboxylase